MNTDKREIFLKMKSRIQILFPNAKTLIDEKGLFFVVDGSGRSLLNHKLYKHSKTVFDAWKNVENVLFYEKILKLNTNRFAENKLDVKVHK